MAFADDYKAYLVEKERRKTELNKMKAHRRSLGGPYIPTPVNTTPSDTTPQTTTPTNASGLSGLPHIKPATPTLPENKGNLYDLMAATTWNLLDSVTFGAADAFFDTEYDLEKWSEMSDMSKVGTALGQGVGFLVPMVGISKGTSAVVKALDKFNVGNKAHKAITTSGKVREAALNTGPMAANMLDKVKKGSGSAETSADILEGVLNAKSSKQFLKNYEISETAINDSRKLFKDDLTVKIHDAFKGGLKSEDASILADDLLINMQKGGIHRNTIEGVLFKTLGGTQDPILKNTIKGFASRAGENMVNFTLYNAASGYIQELKNGGDYEYWKGLASTAPATVMFSLAAPFVDLPFLAGGKAATITGDARRVMKILTKPVKTSKGKPISEMADDEANLLLKMWDRYKTDSVEGFMQQLGVTANQMKNGTVKSGVAQELVEKLWRHGRKDLLKEFGKESIKDLWGSLPRMTIDAMLFSGINMVHNEGVLSRLGPEDAWVNAMIGAFIAKRHRPLPHNIGQFTQNVHYKPEFDAKMALLDNMGIDTKNLEIMVKGYDFAQFNKAKAKSFSTNPEIRTIVDMISEKWNDVKDRPSFQSDGYIINNLNTLSKSIERFYNVARLLGEDANGSQLEPIDLTKFKDSELQSLNKFLEEFKINERPDGTSEYLKGNILKLQQIALKGSSDSITEAYLNAAKDMANVLGIKPSEINGEFVFPDIEGNYGDNSAGINRYRETISMLEDMGARVRFSQDKRATIEDDLAGKNERLLSLADETLDILIQEHWGDQYSNEGLKLSWHDNPLLDEVRNSRQFEALEKAALVNLEDLSNLRQEDPSLAELGDRLLRQFAASTPETYKDFDESYVLVDAEGKDINFAELKDDKASDISELVETARLMHLIATAGKQKSSVLPGNMKRVKLNIGSIESLKETFDKQFKPILSMDKMTSYEYLNKYIIERRYEGYDYTASQLAVLSKISDDGKLLPNKFPTKSFALQMAEVEAIQKGWDDERKILNTQSIEALYKELEGMGDIINFSDKDVFPPGIPLTRIKVPVRGWNQDMIPVMSYSDYFVNLERYTQKHYIEKIRDVLYNSVAKNSNTADLFAKITNDIDGAVNKIFASVNNEVQISKGDVEFVEDKIRELEKLDVSDDTRSKLSDARKMISDIVEKTPHILDVAGVANEDLAREINTGRLKIKSSHDSLKSVLDKETKDKKLLARMIQRIVYYGDKSSTREKALIAYDHLRDYLLKTLDESTGVSMKELLEKYNASGDYNDAIKVLRQQNYAMSKVYSPSELSRIDEAIKAEVEQQLKSIRDSEPYISADYIANHYNVLRDPLKGGFDRKTASEITAAAVQADVHRGTSQEAYFKTLFQAKLDEVTNKILYAIPVENREKFMSDEIGPMFNSLVNSTTSPMLSFSNGRFKVDSVSRINTPLDDYVKRLRSHGLDLIEVSNTAIHNERAMSFNAIEGIDALLSDAINANTAVGDEQKLQISLAEQLQEFDILSDNVSYDNRYATRIGMSNYKNILHIHSLDADNALLNKFNEWIDAKKEFIKSQPKYNRNQKKILQNIDSLFGDIISKNLNSNSLLSDGQTRVMLRTMYHDGLNSNMINNILTNTVLSTDIADQRLKFIKYVHVVEGSQTSQLSRNLTEYLAEKNSELNTQNMFVRGAQNLLARPLGEEVGVMVINDENDRVSDLFNNQKFALRMFDRTITAINDRLNSLPAGVDRTELKSLLKRHEDMYDDISKGNKYSSLGNAENIVSLLNGISFVGDDLAAVGMGVRGTDISGPSVGLKPVVRHNDSARGSTLILKTLFIHDEAIARAMRNVVQGNDHIDIVTFKSAAKSFSGDLADIKRLERDTDPLERATTKSGLYSAILSQHMDKVFKIGLEDIGINYPTKGVHPAVMTPSIYGSLTDAESVSSFHKWIGYESAAGDGRPGNLINTVTDIYSKMQGKGRNGALAAILERMQNEGYNLDSPTVSTLNKLMSIGLDADSPMVKNDVLRLLKSNFVDQVKRPLNDYGTVSVLVPPDSYDRSGIGSLKMPLYEKDISNNDIQTVYGGIKVAYDIYNKEVGDASKVTFIFNDPETHRDGIFSLNDKKEMSAFSQYRPDHKYDTNWMNDFVSKLFKTTEDSGAKLTYSKIDEILAIIKEMDISTYDGRRGIENGGRRYLFSKETLKNIKEADVGLGVSALRIPKQSTSDFVINRVEGSFEQSEGNMVSVNPFELATKHQGDYDVDKLFYYFDTPHSILKTIAKNSGNVLDPSQIDNKERYGDAVEKITQELDLFEQGANAELFAPAGRSTDDGLFAHTQALDVTGKLLGSNVKMLSTINSLSNAGLTIFNSPITYNKDIQQRLADLISSSVDVHAGIFKVIKEVSPRELQRWVLFGQNKDDTRYPVVKGKDLFGREVTSDQYRERDIIEEDIALESLAVMGRMQRVFSGVFDENGGRSPELSEIRDIYNDAKDFYDNPNKYIFMKLFYRYAREDTNGVSPNLAKLINKFFPEENKIRDIRLLLNDIQNGDLSNIPFSRIDKYAPEVLPVKLKIFDRTSVNKNTNKLLDSSPAGIVLKRLGATDITQGDTRAQSFGYIEEPINAGLKKLINDFTISNALGGTIDNAINLISKRMDTIVDPNGKSGGLNAYLGDVEKRSALHQYLTAMIKDTQRRINATKSDRFADENYLSRLNLEEEGYQLSLNNVESKINDIDLQDVNKITVLKHGSDAYLNTDINKKDSFIYRVIDPNDDYKFHNLVPERKLRYGEEFKAYGSDYVLVKNPLLKGTLDGDTRDGFAWFMAVDGGSKALEGLEPEMTRELLSQVAVLRGNFRNLRSKTISKSKDNKAQKGDIWEWHTIQVQNNISNFYRNWLSGISVRDDSYEQRLRTITNALLKPRAIFGTTAENREGVQLPQFVQDQTFAKSVLEYLLSVDSVGQDVASEIIGIQSDFYRAMRDGMNLPPETSRRILDERNRREYLSSGFNYQNLNAPDFIRDLVFDNVPVPAALLHQIENNYPGIYKRKYSSREAPDGTLIIEGVNSKNALDQMNKNTKHESKSMYDDWKKC